MRRIVIFGMFLSIVCLGTVVAQDGENAWSSEKSLNFSFWGGNNQGHGNPSQNGSWVYIPGNGNPHGGGYGNNHGYPSHGGNHGGYNPGYGNNHGGYHPGYGGNNGYNYVNEASFANFLQSLKYESFDANKLKMAQFYGNNANLSTQQIGRIMNEFTFDSYRLEFGKSAYAKCYDKYNYPTLRSSFTFTSYFNSLMDFVGY